MRRTDPQPLEHPADCECTLCLTMQARFDQTAARTPCGCCLCLAKAGMYGVPVTFDPDDDLDAVDDDTPLVVDSNWAI